MIRFENVDKSFKKKIIFRNLNQAFEEKGVFCILGPSGCGKTTFLNLAAGLLLPDKGRIIKSSDKISYVFQEPRLLPWKNIRDNLVYASGNHLSRKEKTEKAEWLMSLLEISEAAFKKPVQVSGGMAKRASLGRALLAEHDILFMDEPFSSLDPDLKERIISRIIPWLKNSLVLLVTHDYLTAQMLSDKVLYFTQPPVEIREINRNEIKNAVNLINNKIQ